MSGSIRERRTPVPEEMEVETQDIHETVQEAIEREGSWLLNAML
jgi:hypothetical protein